MAGQRRILATSVAGLQAAVDTAVARFQSTITGSVLEAVRAQIVEQVAAVIGEQPAPNVGGSYRSATIDLGTAPRREHWSTVHDPDLSAESAVFATVAPIVTGKDDDESGMDVIDVWCVPGDGLMAVRMTGLTGRISRQFAINYMISEV